MRERAFAFVSGLNLWLTVSCSPSAYVKKVRTAEGGEVVNQVSVGHGSDILATAGADLNHSNSSVVLRLAHKS